MIINQKHYNLPNSAFWDGEVSLKMLNSGIILIPFTHVTVRWLLLYATNIGLFDLILYVPSTIFQLNRDGWVFLGWTSTKLSSNPLPLGLKSSTLPLSYCAPSPMLDDCFFMQPTMEIFIIFPCQVLLQWKIWWVFVYSLHAGIFAYFLGALLFFFFFFFKSWI